MQIRAFLVCLFSLFIGHTFAQSDQHALLNIQVDVVYLASDFLEGRETGKDGETRAAAYISSRFKELGLTPKGDAESYIQAFGFDYKAHPHASETQSRNAKNVVGYIDNGAAYTVVIGAHYDHLGKGSFGSRVPNDTSIHNGADDNASGVGAMLYLAERIKQSDLKGHNFLFIAFSGEEMGLYGSKHYVKQPTIDLEKVSYMLNLDMVGRLDEEKNLMINGAGTSPVWKEAFSNITSPELKIKTSDSGVGASDHTSFYLANIPVLHFFTGAHDDYHKPQDDSNLINFSGIQQVTDWMYALVTRLNTHGKIEFTKTKDDTGRRAAKYKVSLGIMPDYAADGEGVKIDAVLDDRPAQKAGIEAGDIILKMGAKEVKDIYDYMEGLSKLEKGSEVTITVKRGKKKLEKKVVF